MTAMTIHEFLLARIAEDEASLEGYPGNYAPVTRVRAECTSKRKLLRIHTIHPEGPEVRLATAQEPASDRCTACIRRGWPCRTLQALAEVYADHHHYDDAWRP